MLPDSERHGTITGYKIDGCHCEDCTSAMLRYEKRRKFDAHQGRARTLSAVGFKRRVRALMALGWTHKTIAEELGIATGNLANRMKYTGHVNRTTHERMCEIYDRLSMTLPPDTMVNRRTRDLSRRRGYVPPLAWDDETIDDPAAAPVGVGAVRRNLEIRSTRAAELEHFAHMGDTLETACERLGIDHDTLWKWCSRNGHRDLFERLAERSRRGANQWTNKVGAA